MRGKGWVRGVASAPAPVLPVAELASSEPHEVSKAIVMYITSCANATPVALSSAQALWNRVLADELSVKANAYMACAMLTVHRKCKTLSVSAVEDVFSVVKCPTTACVNALLACYAKAQPVPLAAAEGVYSKLVAGEYGAFTKPNANTVNTMLSLYAACEPPAFAQGHALWQSLKDGKLPGVVPDIMTVNSLLTLYAKAGNRLGDALELWTELTSRQGVFKHMDPTPITLNAMIAVYTNAQPCRYNEIVELVERMSSGEFGPTVRPTLATANSLLKAACSATPLPQPSVDLFQRIVAEEGLHPDAISLNSLLTLLSRYKPPRVDDAIRMFDEIVNGKNGPPVRPTTHHVTSLLTVLVRGSPTEVLQAFKVWDSVQRGKLAAIPVNAHMISCVITACHRCVPVRPEFATALWRRVRCGEFPLVPTNSVHIANGMVQLYGLCGPEFVTELNETLRLFTRNASDGSVEIKPDAQTLSHCITALFRQFRSRDIPTWFRALVDAGASVDARTEFDLLRLCPKHARELVRFASESV